MSKMNLSVFLSTYSDLSASNAPSLSNFKWNRSLDGLVVENPISQALSLAPGASQTLFSGSRVLSSDNTTVYSIALKPLSTNTYVLSATSGTLPNYRTPRSIGSDATTQVTTTLNGPLITFTSTGGTLFNLAPVQVGDYVRIGSLFNQLNQGSFKILAKTTTSFTVENEVGFAEGPITLGAGYASQVQVYSAAGTQIGDTLIISGGFSSVTQGSYKITDTSANSLEFFSTDILPSESGIMTTALNIYYAAKNLVYLECDQKATVTINGSQVTNMEPFVINDSTQPGIFMVKSTVYSLAIQNNSLDSANVFLATVE